MPAESKAKYWLTYNLSKTCALKVPGKRLTVVLDQLEVWRKSKVLVLTPTDAPPELMRLSYALEQTMSSFGQDQEHKDFDLI